MVGTRTYLHTLSSGHSPAQKLNLAVHKFKCFHQDSNSTKHFLKSGMLAGLQHIKPLLFLFRC